MKLSNALFLATGLIAVGAILISAAAVLDKGQEAESLQVYNEGSVLPDEPVVDQGNVDPAAVGVIVAREWRSGLLAPYAPDGTVVGSPQPGSQDGGVSADGVWQAGSDCDEKGFCRLAIYPVEAGNVDLDEVSIALDGSFFMGEWAPGANLFAALDGEWNLYLVEPETLTSMLIKPEVRDIAWTSGRQLTFAANEGSGAGVWRLDLDSDPVRLASVESPIYQIFESPDGKQVAFGQEDPDGWRLLAVDVAGAALRDFGHLGAGGEWWLQPKVSTFSIAWSPDMRYLAVGPVDPPFYLHVIPLDAEGGAVRSYALEKGFAGELKWSPDGSELAISTYAPDRVWHEVYVVGMDALDAGPRFLLDGCEIVWSPDGVFVAVKREPTKAGAVAAIRVGTGDYWHIVNQYELSPIAWGEDEMAAFTQAMQPTLRSIQLGK
jgi:hypothetical protein